MYKDLSSRELPKDSFLIDDEHNQFKLLQAKLLKLRIFLSITCDAEKNNFLPTFINMWKRTSFANVMGDM